MSTRVRTRVATAVVMVVLAGGMLGAGSAFAATVSVENGTLVYRAEPGEANFLFIYPSQLPGYTGVYDEGASITAGSGCMVAVEAYADVIPRMWVCTTSAMT